eukprot:14806301-Ditylum_brightwellii.AAC.1
MYTEACRTAGVPPGELEHATFATQHQRRSILRKFSYATMLDADLSTLPSNIPADTMDLVAHK